MITLLNPGDDPSRFKEVRAPEPLEPWLERHVPVDGGRKPARSWPEKEAREGLTSHLQTLGKANYALWLVAYWRRSLEHLQN